MTHDLTEVREELLPTIKEQGFLVSPSLPHIRELALRPLIEIAKRFAAIRSTGLFVCLDEKQAPTDKITNWIQENGVEEYLSDFDKSLFSLSRSVAHETYLNDIGWKFENAQALAWILGFGDANLTVDGEMIADDVVSKMFFEFAPNLETDLEEWLNLQSAQDEDTVVVFEDMFYCILNAGRSAIAGNPECVPEWWDPVVSTGVIQEKRHSLTWSLTPGCKWEDTDISS